MGDEAGAAGGQAVPDVGLVQVPDRIGRHCGACLRVAEKRGRCVPQRRAEVGDPGRLDVFLHGGIERLPGSVEVDFGPDAGDLPARAGPRERHASVQQHVLRNALRRTQPGGETRGCVDRVADDIPRGVARLPHQGDQQRSLVTIISPTGVIRGRRAQHAAVGGHVVDTVVDIIEDPTGIVPQRARQRDDLGGRVGGAIDPPQCHGFSGVELFRPFGKQVARLVGSDRRRGPADPTAAVIGGRCRRRAG